MVDSKPGFNQLIPSQIQLVDSEPGYNWLIPSRVSTS
jgi:hypothetical protein